MLAFLQAAIWLARRQQARELELHAAWGSDYLPAHNGTPADMAHSLSNDGFMLDGFPGVLQLLEQAMERMQGRPLAAGVM